MSTRFERHPRMKKYLEAYKGDAKSPIFRTLWDLFYFSFMVGLAANKKIPETEWPDKMEMERDMANYSERKLVLMATLLIKKLKTRGREVQTTKDLQKELNDIANTKIGDFNEEGITLFNEYAYWGFEKIEKKLAKNPSNPGTEFLAIYEDISKNLG